jgi:hypothetical protein
VSEHDSVTKRKRRPKSDRRVDYSARTMAALRELEKAAKLRESPKPPAKCLMVNGHDSSIAGFAPALRGFGLRLTLRLLDALLEFWQDDRWNRNISQPSVAICDR